MHRYVVLAGLLASAALVAVAADPKPADPAEGVLPVGADGKALNLDFETGTLKDWTAEGDAFKGQMLRLRKLVVQPGSVVPWHSHETRPANITVVEGSITEYRSNCKVPIVHKAGDTIPEFGNFSHWWKNTGKKKTVLFSADLLPPATDDHMM